MLPSNASDMAAASDEQRSAPPLPPTQTPIELIQTLTAACLDADFEQYQTVLRSWQHDQLDQGRSVADFYSVMIEAVRQDRRRFAAELLHLGLSMHYLYLLEAVRHRSTDVLDLLIPDYWDINKPVTDSSPPILGYVASHAASFDVKLTVKICR